MRHLRILIKVLLVVAFVLAFMAALICWPTSTSEKMRIAAAMSAFYNQPHPRGLLNEQLPALLAERDPKYYTPYPNNPSWVVEPGSMSLRYYYRRFGINYEKNLRLFHAHPEDAGWTFTSETGTRFFGPWVCWRERAITFAENQ